MAKREREEVPELTTWRMVGWNRETKVWRTREALAKAIRAQETRGAHAQDWIPMIGLRLHEGFGA